MPVKRDMHLMPLSKDQPEVYKIINGSQDFPYMIRQRKSSPTKIDRKNLQVCLPKVGGLISKMIFLKDYPK